jgi:hypothetical protein
VLVLMSLQPLFSRALANWAAVAYPAATILVTAELLRHRPRLFRISLGLHLGAALVIAVAPIFASDLAGRTGQQFNPFARVVGWRELAETTRRLADMQGAKTILADSREVTAELLYYLRDVSLPILIWPRGAEAHNQFEMLRPYTSSAPEPLLYVTLGKSSMSIAKRFGTADMLEQDSFPSETRPARVARFFLLRSPNSDVHD